MGFRVLLLAVSGKTPEAIHRDYGVRATEKYEEIPESPVTGAMLPTSAYLLYVNDEITPDDEVLAQLSRHASLLACYANETVMQSALTLWADGRKQWSVWHDAQHAADHLETSGNVPEELLPIRDRLLADQAEDGEVDHLFDIPIELFVALGGHRYDQDIPGAEPEPWQVLVRE